MLQIDCHISYFLLLLLKKNRVFIFSVYFLYFKSRGIFSRTHLLECSLCLNKDYLRKFRATRKNSGISSSKWRKEVKLSVVIIRTQDLKLNVSGGGNGRGQKATVIDRHRVNRCGFDERQRTDTTGVFVRVVKEAKMKPVPMQILDDQKRKNWAFDWNASGACSSAIATSEDAPRRTSIKHSTTEIKPVPPLPVC